MKDEDLLTVTASKVSGAAVTISSQHNNRIGIGLLGAEITDVDQLYAQGDNLLNQVRLEMIELRILRIEKALRQADITLDDIPLKELG